MVIRFPLYQHNAISIRNLVFTIYSRGSLMSKATGGYFYVSDDLVNDLQHAVGHDNLDNVLAIIKNSSHELSGLSFDYELVLFTGFPDNPECSKAWTLLANAINKTALKQLHIRAKRSNEPNEKFAFKTWLSRLGLTGQDIKNERRLLYKNLSGHTAFRTDEVRNKWIAKHMQRRTKTCS